MVEKFIKIQILFELIY